MCHRPGKHTVHFKGLITVVLHLLKCNQPEPINLICGCDIKFSQLSYFVVFIRWAQHSNIRIFSSRLDTRTQCSYHREWGHRPGRKCKELGMPKWWTTSSCANGEHHWQFKCSNVWHSDYLWGIQTMHYCKTSQRQDKNIKEYYI